MTNDKLTKLLQQQAIWKASERINASNKASVSSGYAVLDQHLSTGGWPKASMIELLYSDLGIGELRLLLPMLTHYTQHKHWVSLIAPPYLPYAPELERLGVDISKLLIIQTHKLTETLWASHQSLLTKNFQMALVWLPKSLPLHALKKLQLACEQSKKLCFLLRPMGAAKNASVARVRIMLSPSNAQAISAKIIKQRGSSQSSSFHIPLSPDLSSYIAVPKQKLRVYHPGSGYYIQTNTSNNSEEQQAPNRHLSIH